MIKKKLFKNRKIQIAYYINNRCVGNLYLYDINQPAAYIEYVNVKDQYQHKGIGTSLLKEAFRLAQDEGCITISLFVKIDNLNAIRLYKSLGFVISLYWPEKEKGYHYLMTRIF